MHLPEVKSSNLNSAAFIFGKADQFLTISRPTHRSLCGRAKAQAVIARWMALRGETRLGRKNPPVEGTVRSRTEGNQNGMLSQRLPVH